MGEEIMLPRGGFPFSYAFDIGEHSVPGVLSLIEGDHFEFLPFLLDLIFYWIVIFLIIKIVRKFILTSHNSA